MTFKLTFTTMSLYEDMPDVGTPSHKVKLDVSSAPPPPPPPPPPADESVAPTDEPATTGATPAAAAAAAAVSKFAFVPCVIAKCYGLLCVFECGVNLFAAWH